MFLVFLFGLSHITKRGHAQAGEQPAVSHRTSPVALTDIDKKTKASNVNQFGQENTEKNQLQSHALSLCSRMISCASTMLSSTGAGGSHRYRAISSKP